MLEAITLMIPIAAAGWAAIGTLLMGGGIGTFIILFIVFKLLGK